MAEVEVVAFMNFTHVQILFQDFFGELARGKQGKIAPEGKQQHRVDAGAFEPAQLFRGGREQLQSCFDHLRLGRVQGRRDTRSTDQQEVVAMITGLAGDDDAKARS